MLRGYLVAVQDAFSGLLVCFKKWYRRGVRLRADLSPQIHGCSMTTLSTHHSSSPFRLGSLTQDVQRLEYHLGSVKLILSSHQSVLSLLCSRILPKRLPISPSIEAIMAPMLDETPTDTPELAPADAVATRNNIRSAPKRLVSGHGHAPETVTKRYDLQTRSTMQDFIELIRSQAAVRIDDTYAQQEQNHISFPHHLCEHVALDRDNRGSIGNTIRKLDPETHLLLPQQLPLCTPRSPFHNPNLSPEYRFQRQDMSRHLEG